MDFYARRYRFKLFIIAAALAISAASLWYTNTLVQTLAKREKSLIDLNAKALQAISSGEDNQNQNFLLDEIISVNNSIPILLTDENNKYQDHRNFEISPKLNEAERSAFIELTIEEMKAQYEPIEINLYGVRQYIYYKNSFLITQLKYYPFVQLVAISIFGLISYMAFSNSRRAEQNRVWVGLAKETAHQLGTPISALIGWVEYFKTIPELDKYGLVEAMQQDIDRLQMITERFSNIGSEPTLQVQPISPVISDILNYLSSRISSKIKLHFEGESSTYQAAVNPPLFGWVMENLIKNATDAIGSEPGNIYISLQLISEKKLAIDIKDTGKGIAKAQIRKVFDPGFTTKKRGWGLGLTLTKRIVENYHQGKIYVKHSEIGKGTTFRIVLNVMV